MTRTFYSQTSMGNDFIDNPIVDVQGRQLSLVEQVHGEQIRVLDLGCGAGTPTKLLMSDTSLYHVTGADLSEQALACYVSETQRCGVQLDAQQLPFADGSFDVVVSDDVIEHLVDTDSYAREISRVLGPRGWLFLSTPNLAAWFNRIALLFGVQPAFSEVSFERVFGRPGGDIVGHLRLFTSRSIREFLTHHDFHIVDVRGARFDALPNKVRKVDGFFARCPSLAGNTVVAAQKKA
ncbi:MAG: methyltransferase domain-containing protein [Acidimicrobiales bacterium]